MANNTDLAAAIRLLAEKLTQERVKRPETTGEMFERLAKVKPSYFKGQSYPAFLENWIREFEKLFEVVNCPGNMRVGHAVLYLKDEADLWWRENGARLSAAEGFNWEAFVVALRGKFHPAFMRKQKAQEFINLRMGSMTIFEYYGKFIALSRFTLEVVATEELRAQRFKQGLTEEIQLGLGGRNNQDNRNKGKPKRVHHCKFCDKNHPRKDCKREPVTCNYCQKKGHREYECYSKHGKDLKGQGNSNQVRSGSNQSGNQGSKPGGLQNNQGNYSKPAGENPN
ncbi:uncharacterized protein LOC125498650 [Beta vulgaris subsp. vulgaris]|uniref:uncharacterized protein LOC125498650 n=1 Tax=Beta vulgaris subsp. vulgaris TaxID=3555 RepID=UPI0020368BD2|nr:uncharacterized protein LOC125498650 [Beta vulgaris subsp. vulgaris]